MESPYGVTAEQWRAELVDQPRYRADQLWAGLWDQDRFIEEIETLPGALRARLAAAHPRGLTEAAHAASDRGATTKWAFTLADGVRIETVLMAYGDRVTVCVSSQGGCAMGCTFCATGQGGFSRHLSAAEIYEQVVVAARAAAPRRLSNVVFMGMGEPLANYAATVGALRLLRDRRGLSARNLTVSTVGVAPAIERLAAEGIPLTLAVSLHAANDESRSALVPLNRRYPLGRLAAACARWRAVTGRRISFEWALIDQVNDAESDADELAAYAAPLGAHVNLIPLNPTPGYLVRGSGTERVAEFATWLGDRGINATVRRTRGRSIDAACGQLAGAPRALAPRAVTLGRRDPARTPAATAPTPARRAR